MWGVIEEPLLELSNNVNVYHAFYSHEEEAVQFHNIIKCTGVGLIIGPVETRVN